MTPYNRFYKCLHYQLYELVDETTLLTLGDSAWRLFDPYLLSTMDRIRNRYNAPVTVNNWHSGGPYRFRGFRPSNCTEGAPLSAHRRGQAFDFDVQGMTAEKVRADILKNKGDIDFMFINAIEAGTNWIHISTENVPNRIKVFNP